MGATADDPVAEPDPSPAPVADDRRAHETASRRGPVPAVSFAVVGAVTALAYAACSDAIARALIYDAVGAASVAAILAGIAIHRPPSRVPWLIVALALASWLTGDVLWDYAKLVLGVNPFPWWSDAPYLLGYLVFAVGCFRLVRSPGRRVSTAAVIDTALVVLGFALAFWVFLVQPALTEPDTTGLGRLVATLYPVGDVMLLAVVVRLVASVARMTAPIRLLVAGLVLQVAADTLFAQTYVDLTDSGPALESIWILGYVAFGTAGLVPSMARAPSAGDPGSDVSAVRLALLLAASLLPPAILLVQWAAGLTIDAPVIAIASAAMFSLVILRIAGLVRMLRVIVADREMLAAELRHLALHDMLTGLPNRAVFADRLDQALARRRRDTQVGIVYIDLDTFKVVNDDHGHQVGDALLKVVAGRIAGAIRAGDAAARLGGDEFAVIVDGVGDPCVVGEVADRIRAVVEKPVTIGEVAFLPRASVGLAIGTPGRDDADHLLREADLAMYAEKRERVAVPGVAWSAGSPGLAAPAAP